MRPPVVALSALLTACASPAHGPPPAPAAAPRSAPAPDRAPAPESAPPDVAYTLSPVIADGALTALAVEIRLNGDASGVTRIALPSEWAGARELWRYVRDLEISGARAVREDGPAVREIQAAPGAPLRVRYRVVSAYDRDPTASDGQPFAPIIRPGWFHVFGEALFAAPKGRERAPARFTWSGAPPGFGFASDLEHLAGARPGVVDDVRESVAVGGPGLTVHGDEGGEVRVASLGEYTFSRAAFADLVRTIIGAERAFWGDGSAPFLVVLAPLRKVEGSMSLGGSGRTDAFTVLMAEDAPAPRLRHLLAHEHFHTWNSDQLGGQQDGAGEFAGKWFSEGFTEFYTRRLLLRAGLFSLEDFVESWNGALLEYAVSPVRDAPNARVMQDYWSVPEVGRLPYARGALLAVLWEERLRRATAGARDLDDVLLAMRARVRAAERKLAPDAAGLFPQVYRELGGPDLAEDLARLVDRGETISLPEDAFGACARVASRRRRSFDRGWDAAATGKAGNVVTGLRAGSPAHRAGLREGMTILRREAGEPGDSTVPYALRVRDGGRERVIRFKPEGDAEIVVQQLALAPGLSPERRAACARTLSGQ